MKLVSVLLTMLVVLSCAPGLQDASQATIAETPLFDYENLGDDPFYATDVIHYMSTSAGGTTPVAGQVAISKSNLVIKLNSNIEIQQGLVIDKLTVPIPSIKNLKVKRSGKAFSFELGPTKMVFDSNKAREIEQIIAALQKLD